MAPFSPPTALDIEREILRGADPGLALEYAALNQLNHVTADPSDAVDRHRRRRASPTARYGRPCAASGSSTLADIEAAGIRLLKLGMPIPFNFSTRSGPSPERVEEVLVIEEKHPNVESRVKEALYNEAVHPLVVGKTDESGAMLFPGHGLLTADMIIPVLRRRLADRLGDRLAPPTPSATASRSPSTGPRSFAPGAPTTGRPSCPTGPSSAPASAATP